MLHHLLKFLVRAALHTPSLLSSNWLAVFVSLVLFAIPQLIDWGKRGWAWESLRKNWSENLKVGIWTVAVVWICLFLYNVAREGYDDHQGLVARARALPSKDAEITQLKNRLAESCYMPDRHFAKMQREIVFNSLKTLAEKYNHPSIDIGFAAGDMESERFGYQVYLLFKDAGWNPPSPDKLIQKPLRHKPDDPPDVGFSEGISIQEISDANTAEAISFNKMTRDIQQAFQPLDGTEMQMRIFPVKNATRQFIWVGIKKVDWLDSMKRP